MLDPGLVTTARGIWAVKWSFVGLFVTAVLQLGVVAVSGSMALLADTIHNFADAAIRDPSVDRLRVCALGRAGEFPYGYGRWDDLAGVTIVLVVLEVPWSPGTRPSCASSSPSPSATCGRWPAAALLGFLGNQAVRDVSHPGGPRDRQRGARDADGYHARADGLTSLAVLGGAAGVGPATRSPTPSSGC